MWLSLIGLQKKTNLVRNRKGRACIMGAIKIFLFFFFFFFLN
jgi:hypothetical protein